MILYSYLKAVSINRVAQWFYFTKYNKDGSGKWEVGSGRWEQEDVRTEKSPALCAFGSDDTEATGSKGVILHHIPLLCHFQWGII